MLALAAGVLVVGVIGAMTVVPRPTIAGVLGLVVIAICLTALYRVTIEGTFAPVAVTFWSFVAVWVGFAPLLQIRDRRFPWPDLALDQHFVTAQVILLFAVTAYWIGYTRRVPPARPARSRRLDVTVEKAVTVAALAVLLSAVSLPRTGGLAVRFTSRDQLQDAIREAGLTGGDNLALLGLLSTLPAAVSLVGLLLCLICWRERTFANDRARLALLAATAVAVVLNIVYNNPLSANRFASFSVMLAAVLALVRFDGLLRRALFSAGMLLGLAIIYPLANLFRNDRSRGNLRFGTDAYYTFDFDGFQQTVNSVRYVDGHGHTWGHHLSSALLFWVPRSLWEGKAIPAGNAVALDRGYVFQNLALPFWAEVFVEFTLVGVVVLFFFYGKGSRLLDRSAANASAGLALALTVLFGACQIGLLRGPLGAQIPFVGAAFVVLLIGVAGWRGRPWGLTRPVEPLDDPPLRPEPVHPMELRA
jgi:hypothetical protein